MEPFDDPEDVLIAERTLMNGETYLAPSAGKRRRPEPIAEWFAEAKRRMPRLFDEPEGDAPTPIGGQRWK
jgi:hypothetical protein